LKICGKCGSKSASEYAEFCIICGTRFPPSLPDITVDINVPNKRTGQGGIFPSDDFAISLKSDSVKKGTESLPLERNDNPPLQDLPLKDLSIGNAQKMHFSTHLKNNRTEAMQIDYSSGKPNLNRIGLSLIKLLVRYFPFIIFLGVIIGLTVALILDRLDYAVRALVIVIPALLASYAIRKIYEKGTLNKNLIFFNTNNYWITGLFTALFLLSISSVIISPERPWFYFILIAVLFCVISVQIFSNNRNQNLILLEIVAIMINLAYCVVLKYPYYFGWTDTPYLVGISQVTLLTGHTIPSDLELSYANFPLYHVYLAEIAATLGLDIQTALFIVMIIPYAIATVFIYKIFYQMNNNQQLSLLLCLLYASLSVIIFYGTYIQARVMAYIGFIILLYILFKDASAERQKIAFLIIFFLSLVYIILVHQVSIFQILPILVLLFILEFIFRDRTTFTPGHIAIIFVLTFSYWIYVASDYFHEIFFRLNIFKSQELLMIKPSVQVVNQWDFVFNNLDIIMLVFFVLCGIGYLLYTERKNYGIVFALIGLIMIPFFVPNPLQLLWTNMQLFRSDRMMLYLAPFIAFLMASGMHVCLNYFEKRRTSKKICGSLLIVIIFFFAIFSLTLTNASDSTDIPWANQTQRNYFNSEEMNGLRYSMNYIPYGSFLSSDYPVLRYFGIYKNFSKSEELGYPHFKTTNLNYSGSAVTGQGYLIIREGEFQDNGLIFESNIPSYYLKFPFNQENQAKINTTFAFNDILFSNDHLLVAFSRRHL
jgi:hypothetical protein